MARANAPFTLTRYLQIDENSEEGEQHEIAEEDAFDEEGNLLEGVHRENVNVKPGDEVELTEEQSAGLHGYLEGYETEEEAQAREERESEATARESATGESGATEGEEKSQPSEASSSEARQPGESGAIQQSDSSATGPAPKASRSKKT
jgi:hypothetical protein